MRERLPIVLSASALLVAVFGATPLGHAAGQAIHAVPPFAKTANFAKFAGNASKLNGRKSTLKGAPGTIPVVGRDGKLPASIGAVGPQGPQGPAGAKGLAGPAGPKGSSGPSGPPGTPGTAGTAEAYSVSVSGPIALTTTLTKVAGISAPNGNYLVWAKAYLLTGAPTTVTCDLRGTDVDESVNTVGPGLAFTVALNGYLRFGGASELVCKSGTGAGTVNGIRITAISVGNVTG